MLRVRRPRCAPRHPCCLAGPARRLSRYRHRVARIARSMVGSRILGSRRDAVNSAKELDCHRGASPLGLPYTRSRAPLRRRAPLAWLARYARSHLGTVAFMTQLLHCHRMRARCVSPPARARASYACRSGRRPASRRPLGRRNQFTVRHSSSRRDTRAICRGRLVWHNRHPRAGRQGTAAREHRRSTDDRSASRSLAHRATRCSSGRCPMMGRPSPDLSRRAPPS